MEPKMNAIEYYNANASGHTVPELMQMFATHCESVQNDETLAVLQRQSDVIQKQADDIRYLKRAMVDFVDGILCENLKQSERGLDAIGAMDHHAGGVPCRCDVTDCAGCANRNLDNCIPTV